jgi:murein DD-endopeptidase MepM/ murein hydrolase activator NlpD
MEYSDELIYASPEEALYYGDPPAQGEQSSTLGTHGLTLVAIVLVAFMGSKVLGGRVERIGTIPQGNDIQAPEPATPLAPAAQPEDFAPPYEYYTITQGIHGAEYGHLAIDIAAGQGAAIQSPIHGIVTELYVDMYGNPTLVIENEVYSVMMLHGEYAVSIGEPIELGQVVGVESNLGYTTDMAGVPCWGRDCGYHTHLNVYDKRIGGNVNPLELLGR